MFVRMTTDRTSRPNALDEFGLTSSSDAIVSLSDFTYKRGTEVFGENEPAEYVYQVKTGAIRSYKLLSDGRRQIAAFHLVGDIFGLQNGAVHRFTAEAIVDTTVRLIKRHSLDKLADSDTVVMRNLLGMTSSNLEHAENHMLLLGRKTAPEKVAAFLVEMDKRLSDAGVIALPMTRLDIADYLGITLETVSRVLSELRKAGVLDFLGVTQREIVIRDRGRLASFDLPA
jgi:CRP/FNR family nitrogen fixation transcriptional regulator